MGRSHGYGAATNTASDGVVRAGAEDTAQIYGAINEEIDAEPLEPPRGARCGKQSRRTQTKFCSIMRLAEHDSTQSFNKVRSAKRLVHNGCGLNRRAWDEARADHDRNAAV